MIDQNAHNDIKLKIQLVESEVGSFKSPKSLKTPKNG